MTDHNPYASPAEAELCPPDQRRFRARVLIIVLLDIALSAGKLVWNLPGLWRAPDASPAVIGGILVLWVVWIGAELFAARLVWRGHAAGLWMLVAFFGIKGTGQTLSLLPTLIRAPSLMLYWPMLIPAIQAICYCVATGWLFLSALQKRGVSDRR